MPTPRLLTLAILLISVFLQGCATQPPKNPDNICDIFREKRSWYKASVRAQKKWGAPLQIPMAIIHQESSFKRNARPPRKWFLGIIPLKRRSSAFGYAQAQNAAWREYRKETGRGGADRNDFDDAVDFVQWYMDKTHRVNGVSKWDTYNQYLNYHEGRGGYARGSHQRKPWLLRVAKRVEARASRYGSQYRSCEKSLRGGFFTRLLGL